MWYRVSEFALSLCLRALGYDGAVQMILDEEMLGILDQGNGNLRLFPAKDNASVHKGTLETMDHINTVVDSLYRRAQKLG